MDGENEETPEITEAETNADQDEETAVAPTEADQEVEAVAEVVAEAEAEEDAGAISDPETEFGNGDAKKLTRNDKIFLALFHPLRSI